MRFGSNIHVNASTNSQSLRQAETSEFFPVQLFPETLLITHVIIKFGWLVYQEGLEKETRGIGIELALSKVAYKSEFLTLQNI